MSCTHSNIPPEIPEKPCPGGPYHSQNLRLGITCRECALERMDAANGWDFEKDMRRGYCPQPGCGVSLGELPAAEQPVWYRMRRLAHALYEAAPRAEVYNIG